MLESMLLTYEDLGDGLGEGLGGVSTGQARHDACVAAEQTCALLQHRC
jgi:hypothetical protein